jgi:alkanesulfonate monooxygenase SsuD/methylene tetrahydromethanopterin reductase-like flavin-dependent oxidoreductase (luciferase family)
VPIWILGSSLYDAQVAAYLGLPFAFAHFAPAMTMGATKIYREHFRPSAQPAAPNVMLGVVVVAAASDREARFLSTRLRRLSLSLKRGCVRPAPATEASTAAGPHEGCCGVPGRLRSDRQ